LLRFFHSHSLSLTHFQSHPDDPAAPPPRPTVDVDVTVSVLAFHQWDRLRMRLASVGFSIRTDGPEGKVRKCLFHLGEIEVDIMPFNRPEFLTPSRMLELGYQSAVPHTIQDDLEILILPAPAFLATKLEAFLDRGIGDIYLSKDLEDIVTLLDGRLGIEDEILSTFGEMRERIRLELAKMLDHRAVEEMIADQLRDTNRRARLIGIMERLSR